MRLGIFGGSFDPVHLGHLMLAECCREQCALDQVWFVPAHVPPHKQGHTLTADQHRLQMLQLATAGYPAFAVSDRECQRGGVSYTVETLSALSDERPDDELFFLMGADSLSDLPGWRQSDRICQLAIPVVVRRQGSPEPDFRLIRELVPPARLATIQQNQVEMPVLDFSSTAIRAAVAAGRSIRFQTPAAVEQYILQHRLYQEDASR
jgi:nicotinate-nucleotide adenylyltransferase